MGESVELVYGSRAPIVPWWERLDPLVEVKWKDTVRSSWESISAKRHTLGLSSDGYITQHSELVSSPIMRSPRMLYNYRSIRIMAMLHEWQQMTTLQIATMIGESRKSTWNTLSDLYDAGIIYRMVPKWWKPGMSPEESGSGSIWRINRKEWTTKQWFDDLENQEWALVTNNSDPQYYGIGETTPTALRHNLITLEVAIKALESSPGIIGAWGESHLNASNLHRISEHETDEVRKNVGDLALITGSGKIVIIETSGSSSMGRGTTNANKIVEKAAAWTAITGKSDLDLYVIFLESSTNPDYGKFTSNVKFGVEEVSTRYVSRKSYRERGQERVMVADSRDWFPMTRAVSNEFVNLNAFNAKSGESLNLIDERDLRPNAKSDVVMNTLASIHTPWWITRDVKAHA